jgi:hypothetical protein
MGKHVNKRHEQPAALRKALRTRCINLAKDVDHIKTDIQRDCIPYWKLDALRDSLNDLADDLKEFA